jgi:hypothetical protein
MYEETFQRLKEANSVLNKLQEAKISEEVDEKYAEVMDL